MEKINVSKISHFDFELEAGRVSIEWTQAYASYLKATAGVEQEVKAVRINGMRRHDLWKRGIEVALEEVLEVLDVTDLTRNLQTLAVNCPSVIEKLNGLVGVLNRLVKD